MGIENMSPATGRMYKEDGSTVNIAELLAYIAGGAGQVKPGNYLYVAKSGDDTTGDGSANLPYLTISKALTIATSGTTIFIFPGTYTEDITFVPSVNLTAASKFAVYVVGTATFSTAGTVCCERIIFKTSGAGNTLNFAGTGVQNLQCRICNFEHTTGAGHCIHWTNTNASSRISQSEGNITQSVSSTGGTAFTSASTAKGSIILQLATVQLQDSLDNVCVNLGGAVVWTQTQDAVNGQFVTANTARFTLTLVTMTTATVPVIVHNSTNATPSVTSSIFIMTESATYAVDGVGAIVFVAIMYGGAGVGGNSTLNGGLGPVPLTMAPIRLRESNLYPALSVASGAISGTFEFDGTDLYFIAGTTRYNITQSEE